MKKLAILSAFAVMVAFSSCKKDINEPTDQIPDSMENMVVPADFNWKTTKDYQLTLEATAMGIVEVNSLQNINFQKAYLQPNQAYTMKLTIPSYEKSIKLRFSGQEVTLELNSGNLNHKF